MYPLDVRMGAHTLVRVTTVKAVLVSLLAHLVLVNKVVRQLVSQVVDKIALLHVRKIVIQLPAVVTIVLRHVREIALTPVLHPVMLITAMTIVRLVQNNHHLLIHTKE